ncbi:MAG: hypothetical protein ACRC2T_13715 [Thermoguttaceae bacterium]
MAQKYLLPCTCGESVPIETTQAGQTVTCSCGLQLQVPTLLKIKKLPEYKEQEAVSDSASNVSDSVQNTGPVSLQSASDQKAVLTDDEHKTSVAKKPSRVNKKVFYSGVVLTMCAIVFFLYILLGTYPKPQNVLNKQVIYTFGGKTAYQDSTPIPYSETQFFTITDKYVDMLSPIDSVMYWETLKRGPEMSENFKENYQALIDTYYIHTFGAAILVLLTASIIVASFFLGQNKTVGTRKGSQW